MYLESRNHLFFTCPFARMCWQYLCPDWTAPASASFAVQDVLVSLKEKIAQPFSMDIIMLVSWEIWTTQNDYIFKKSS